MGRNDMNHMKHLESVALSDCAVLESKEATYQGSWKRAGGRSAWFMARRNMDRLLTMMPAKPVEHESINNVENIRSTLMALKQSVHYNFPPVTNTTFPVPGTIEATMAILDHVLDSYTADDVFARIAEHPKGEDGTVLACIRDLRRYFTLVEAEMIAEGVVEPESRTYEMRTYPQDVYQMIADEKGLDRERVKERIRELFYGEGTKSQMAFATLEIEPMIYTAPKATVKLRVGGDDSAQYIFPNATDVHIQMGEEIIIQLKKGAFDPTFPAAEPPLPAGAVGDTGPMCHGAVGAKGPSGGGYAKEQAERHREPQPTRELKNDDKILASGMVHEAGRPPRPATPEEIAEMTNRPSALSTMRPIGPGTPEDGGHHASLVPWQIDDTYRSTLIDRLGGDGIVNAFYNKRALNVYRLEPIVDGKIKCPREINDCYEWWTHGLTPDAKMNMWVLRRGKVPAELDDQFPKLQREMNTFEYEQSPLEFRFMYVLVQEKWTLASSFDAWAQES